MAGLRLDLHGLTPVTLGLEFPLEPFLSLEDFPGDALHGFAVCHLLIEEKHTHFSAVIFETQSMQQKSLGSAHLCG